MTDKEKLDKLVAEIKGLIGDYNIKTEKYRGMNEQAHQYYGGKRDALSEILKSIVPIQEEPKKCMYSKDNYTDEDRKVLCEGCEEECEFNKREEPVNEDLNKAAEECAEVTYSETNSVLTWRILEDIVIKAFKAGAKWMNNTICSEIEKRLQYMQYAPHRVDTYKELKSLLAYIKSYV